MRNNTKKCDLSAETTSAGLYKVCCLTCENEWFKKPDSELVIKCPNKLSEITIPGKGVGVHVIAGETSGTGGSFSALAAISFLMVFGALGAFFIAGIFTI